MGHVDCRRRLSAFCRACRSVAKDPDEDKPPLSRRSSCIVSRRADNVHQTLLLRTETVWTPRSRSSTKRRQDDLSPPLGEARSPPTDCSRPFAGPSRILPINVSSLCSMVRVQSNPVGSGWKGSDRQVPIFRRNRPATRRTEF